MIQIPAPHLNLSQTLHCGQTFCWKPQDDIWSGWIHDSRVELSQQGEILTCKGRVTEEDLRHYFCLDLPWEHILDELKSDPHLRTAIESNPGLRMIRDPFWECTANFICSSMKQITQIEQINRNLRSIDPNGVFPTPHRIAQADERILRDLKLGYRATHLHQAAKDWREFKRSWNRELTLDQALTQIKTLRGVGDKVGQCILLYSQTYFDAFPIDVWVSRLMKDLYWKKRREPTHKDIDELARKKFQSYRGVAQQFLFHWYRTRSS